MANYKMIASDLDGTLLQEDMSLSAENAAAMSLMAASGVQFVPSSGRTLCEMPAAVLAHESVRYVMYSNGAAIWDKHTDTHTHLCMSRAVSNAVLDIVTQYDCHILVRQGGKSYVDRCQADRQAFIKYRLAPAHCGVIERYATLKDNLISFAYTLDTVECYALFFRDDTDMDACAQRLSAVNGVAAAPSWPHCIELFSTDAGKGAALKKLCEMTDTPVSQTIAVGDSGNDLSMIRAAGLGLATANACEPLKQAADAVICANTEHIARYILEKYL